MMRPFIVMPAAALEAMDMPEMWRPFFILMFRLNEGS